MELEEEKHTTNEKTVGRSKINVNNFHSVELTEKHKEHTNNGHQNGRQTFDLPF